MKLAAHYIILPNEEPIKFGVITLSETNEVVSVTSSSGPMKETARTRFYPGAILVGRLIGSVAELKAEQCSVKQLLTSSSDEKNEIWWISGIDFKNMTLTAVSHFKKLI